MSQGQIIWRGLRTWEGSNSNLLHTLAVADCNCRRKKKESDGDRSSSESQKLVVLLQRSRFCSHHSPLSLCSPTRSQARGFRVLRHRSPPRSVFFISLLLLFSASSNSRDLFQIFSLFVPRVSIICSAFNCVRCSTHIS